MKNKKHKSETPAAETMKGSKAILEINNNTFKASTVNPNKVEAAFDSIIAKNLNGENEPPRKIDVSEIKRDNIVLEKYLRIGDLVVMHMDKEARDWGRKDVPDGTVGIVVGFHRFEDYRGRINNFGHEPGVYMRNGVGMVRWFDGTISTPGSGSLRWLHDNEKKTIERREDRVYSEAYEYEARIGDLPELPFWEMDTVRIILRKRRDRQPWDHTDTVRIRSIDYHRIKDKRNDGSPMPIYDVSPAEEGYGSISMETDDLVLVERGNLWKWFNGQRDQVKFATIEEEIRFHAQLGQETQIECKQGGNYHWPLTAIYPALQAGEIDVVRFSNGFFGGSGSMSAYKMDDPDLSERVRAISLKGYDRKENPMQTRVLAKEWNEVSRRATLRTMLETNTPFLNIDYGNGYIDTSMFEALNLSVIKVENVDDFNFAEVASYVYFQPIGAETKNIPTAATNEINEDVMELSKALRGGGRSRRDAVRIRVQSDKGWLEENLKVVLAACQAFGVIFVDRTGASGQQHKEFEAVNVNVLICPTNDDLPFESQLNGYVFFTHRGMEDLPFDVTVQGA